MCMCFFFFFFKIAAILTLTFQTFVSSIDCVFGCVCVCGGGGGLEYYMYLRGSLNYDSGHFSSKAKYRGSINVIERGHYFNESQCSIAHNSKYVKKPLILFP